MDDANAPHEFDRAFGAADFQELKDFVEHLIESYRSPSRQFRRRPIRPRTSYPLVNRSSDFGPIFEAKFQIKLRRGIFWLAPLRKRFEYVVGPDFAPRQCHVTLRR